MANGTANGTASTALVSAPTPAVSSANRNSATVLIETILEEVRKLSERMDQMGSPTGDRSHLEDLSGGIGEVHGLLSTLPDRIAEAISVVLVRQHRMIIEAIREEFLEAEDRWKPAPKGPLRNKLKGPQDIGPLSHGSSA